MSISARGMQRKRVKLVDSIQVRYKAQAQNGKNNPSQNKPHCRVGKTRYTESPSQNKSHCRSGNPVVNDNAKRPKWTPLLNFCRHNRDYCRNKEGQRPQLSFTDPTNSFLRLIFVFAVVLVGHHRRWLFFYKFCCLIDLRFKVGTEIREKQGSKRDSCGIPPHPRLNAW